MIRAVRACWEVQPLSGCGGLPRPWIFLGGAIDNGQAPDWQRDVVRLLSPYPCTVLNPRRDWWNPDASDEDQYHQIHWELDGQESADIRVYVFLGNTLAPITLLELGLFHARDANLVWVDSGYWRWRNVTAVCERYRVPYVRTWDEFARTLTEWVVARCCDGLWDGRGG